MISRFLALAILFTAAPAFGDKSPADVEFERGLALLDAGKVAEACTAFDASQKLDPQIGTELNQADCREKNGQLATARALFADVAQKTQAASDDRGKKFNKVAVDHGAKLEPRLSHLTVRAAKPVIGLVVRRGTDTITLGAAQPIDGGSYTITAQAPTYRTWSTTIMINREGDQKVIDVPALEIELAPVPAGTVIVDPRRDRPTSRLPLVLGGASAILVVGALGFELSARSVYHDSEVEPDDAAQDKLYNSANTRRHIAQVSAVAGLACGGVAVWLWLRGRHESATPVARGVTVEPMGVAGMQLVGRW